MLVVGSAAVTAVGVAFWMAWSASKQTSDEISRSGLPGADSGLAAQVSSAAEARFAWLGIAAVLIGSALTAAGTLVVFRHDRSDAEADAVRDASTRHASLGADLQSHLDSADSEADVEVAVAAAVERAVPGSPSGVFISDPDDSGHLVRVASTIPEGVGCCVTNASGCPAMRRRQTMTFRSTTMLNACEYLTRGPSADLSAVCVPVPGRRSDPVGVVHLVGAPGAPPNGEQSAAVEMIARRTGDRIQVLRTVSETRQAATTDPLTGLANRRLLTGAAHDLDRAGTAYTVAFGDLDRFKALNDDHGHDIGDEALRLFARVTTENVRPGDVVARYGGEEFVIVFPGCGLITAGQVLNRIRVELANELDRVATLPRFTVSFGLASSRKGRLFDETTSAADQCLLLAKEAGRDRVVSEPRSHQPLIEPF